MAVEDNVFDEMSMNKFIEQYGTVKEYYESFKSSFISKLGFEEDSDCVMALNDESKETQSMVFLFGYGEVI